MVDKSSLAAGDVENWLAVVLGGRAREHVALGFGGCCGPGADASPPKGASWRRTTDRQVLLHRILVWAAVNWTLALHPPLIIRHVLSRVAVYGANNTWQAGAASADVNKPRCRTKRFQKGSCFQTSRSSRGEILFLASHRLSSPVSRSARCSRPARGP